MKSISSKSPLGNGFTDYAPPTLDMVEWAAQSHHGLVQNKIWRLEIELSGIQKSEYKNIISVYCSAVCLNLIKLMVISLH